MLVDKGVTLSSYQEKFNLLLLYNTSPNNFFLYSDDSDDSEQIYKNYNNDEAEFNENNIPDNEPVEILQNENDFPDNFDYEPVEILERNENELPENIDEYESNENISNSDSENIFESSSLLNSSFNGKFGPYFSSSTSALMFAWITKHMICKQI